MVFEILGLLGLMQLAHPNCFSGNDALAPPSSPDLVNTTAFSLDLLKALYPPGASGNLFLSPHSIWVSLLIVYFGAGGRTEREMQEIMRLPDKANALALYKSLSNLNEGRMANQTTHAVLDVVNRIYVDDDVNLRYCAKSVLAPAVHSIDYGNSEKAVKTINKFVKEATRGMIRRLLRPDDVEGVAMMLVNAAYFKGVWEVQFDPSRTQREEFWVSQRRFKMVEMMTTTKHFNTGYSRVLQSQVLEMPFKGNQYSMLVFLPRESQPLETLLQRLTQETLQAAMRGTSSLKVTLKIPKFKMEHTLRDELKQALMRMGIQDVFSDWADLTNFFPDGGMKMKGGIHKAVMEVNEEGAEAAAATVLQIIPRMYIEPVDFTCNRPFLFLIHDNHTNTILFMGVFSKPT